MQVTVEQEVRLFQDPPQGYAIHYVVQSIKLYLIQDFAGSNSKKNTLPTCIMRPLSAISDMPAKAAV